MEKRVVPRSNRPVSRGSSDNTLPPTFPSPSSPSSSYRSMEVLPSDPIPLSSLVARPSSSSSSIRPHSPNSRPHSPTTLPPIVASNSTVSSVSASSHSPLGSPQMKRRSLPSLGHDATFLTSLRGASAIGSYTEPEDTDQNNLGNNLNYSENETHENGTGNEETTQVAPEDLMRIDAEQAARRAELDSYMTELQSRKDVVVFPKNFSELLETIENDQLGMSNFWAKFMLDPQLDNPWQEDEQLAKGLERIRKLDLILAKKTKQARELRKAMQPNTVKEEEKKEKEKKIIPTPPQLTQTDEQRIDALLDEDVVTDPHENLHTPFDELEILYDLDVKLAQMVDVNEWEQKGLAHLRPTSASSRASYASNSSYSSYLSRASRSSLGNHSTLTEMEKEEAAAEKARLREIDARLRELANAGDAERNALVKAAPEEIRRLVRMYSSLASVVS